MFYIANTMWQMGTKLLHYIGSPEVAPVRRRAVAVLAGGAIGVTATVMLVPVPNSTQALGVLHKRDQHTVRAGASGFLTETTLAEGDKLARGNVICRLENVDLSAAVERKRAEIEQLRIQVQQELAVDLQAATASEQRLARARQEQSHFEFERDQLLVRAPASGQLTDIEPLKELGRYIRKGEPIASVEHGPWVVKTMVSASGFSDSAPRRGDFVEIRFNGDANAILQGRVTQIAKAGTRTIEEAALTHLGGGSIPVTDDAHEAEQPFFEVTIGLDNSAQASLRHGMTAWIRMSGQSTTIGVYLYRHGLNLLNQLRMAG